MVQAVAAPDLAGDGGAGAGRRRGGAAEPVGAFWARCGAAWGRLQAAAHEGGGQTVAVVTHSPVISALLCHCLGLTPAALNLFRCAPPQAARVTHTAGPPLLCHCLGRTPVALSLFKRAP